MICWLLLLTMLRLGLTLAGIGRHTAAVDWRGHGRAGGGGGSTGGIRKVHVAALDLLLGVFTDQ